MASFSISVPTDPYGNDAYFQPVWARTGYTTTSITFDSGDFKLVLSGTGITSAGAGTLTSARLYQVDLSAGGNPVLLLVGRSTSVLALSVTGLFQEIAANPVGFGAFDHLFRGYDTLTGSSGDDFMRGYRGNDKLYGLAGNDRLDGGVGNDRLEGSSGNDILDGGAGIDTLLGGTGNDGYFVDNAGDQVIETANGGLYDRVELTYAPTSFVLAEHVENLDINHVDAGAPVLLTASGNALSNKISVINLFGNTAERIYGLGGRDRIATGAGNDWLDGGSGTDTMIGGDGNDTYEVTHASDVVVESSAGTAGIDTVRSNLNYALGGALENLTLTGATAVNGTGNSRANRLVGNTLGNLLDGGAGNDTLDGGAGIDTLIGGSGSDEYILASASDVIVETSASSIDQDRVVASFSYRLGATIENLRLAGSDAIDGTGNAKANLISGNTRNNVITGGAGNDSLTGGGGNDRFLFVSTSDGRDTITDFNAGDKIAIVAANFGLVAGAAARVVVNGTATTAAGTFLYTSSSGILSFDRDGSGSGVAVQIARLAPLSVASTDFVLI